MEKCPNCGAPDLILNVVITTDPWITGAPGERLAIGDFCTSCNCSQGEEQ